MTEAAVDNTEIVMEDIFPEKAEFALESKPGKVYKLRPIVLSDRHWLTNKYPGEELSRVLNEKAPDFEQVCVIAYHQMTEEGQADFEPETKKQRDDDGVWHTFLHTGPVKLMDSTKDMTEMLGIIGAVTKTYVDSEPAVKKYLENSVKKSWRK